MQILLKFPLLKIKNYFVNKNKNKTSHTFKDKMINKLYTVRILKLVFHHNNKKLIRYPHKKLIKNKEF